MTTEALKRFHQATPFQPFFIRLGDGQALTVHHPEFLAYSPNSRTAIVYSEDGSFQLIDLLLVTGLEVRNGKNSRRSKRT
jgi:hypothetical protein